MKNLFFIFLLMFFFVNLFSQLKITDHSNGSLHLGYGDGAANFYLGNYVSPSNPEPSNQRGHFAMEASNTTGDFFIYKPWPSPYSVTRYYFYIQQGGNIGIGTTTPAYKLDVNGRIRSTGSLIISDERLKTNIQPLKDEKNKLYSLNAKSYVKSLPEVKKVAHSTSMDKDYDEEVGKKVINNDLFEYGFLAQEVQQIFPELVAEDEEGLLSVNYIGLIPIMLEVLKEQKTELKIQRQLIDNLISGERTLNSDMKINTTEIALLEQNIPNPFNQSTTINYFLPNNIQSAFLCIYDLQGKQLKQIKIDQRGNGSEIISVSQFSAGMYIYALIADGKEIDNKRMILTEK